MGWQYAIGWLITLPFEITAAGITITYWHKYNIGIWIAVFLTSLIIVQFFGVKGYGEVEFVLGIIKILAGMCPWNLQVAVTRGIPRRKC